MGPIDKIIFVRNIKDINYVEKLVLFIIASHLGNNEVCFISVNTIMKEGGLKKKHTVTSAISSLEEKRILIKYGPNEYYRSNQYGINFNQSSKNDSQEGGLPIVTPGLPTVTPGLPTVTRGVTHGNQGGLPIVTGGVTHSNPKLNINKNEIKYKESTARASRSPLSLFLPDDDNKLLCSEFKLSLEEELDSFKNKHSGKGDLQYEFRCWLKNGKAYRDKQQAKSKDEVRSTVPEWGPGHPSYDSLHAPRKKEPEVVNEEVIAKPVISSFVEFAKQKGIQPQPKRTEKEALEEMRKRLTEQGKIQ